MAESGSLASIIVKITADASEFMDGLKKCADQAKEFAAVGATLAGAGAALGGALLLTAQHTADLGDELAKTSQRTGIAVEDLSKLKYAAELSDASLEDLTAGLRKFSTNVVDAAAGSDKQAAAFKNLGIAVTDSSGGLRPMNDLLLDVADQFQSMPKGAEKSALAVQLFGKGGLALIPMLSEGSEGLKNMGDELQNLGDVFDAGAAHKAEIFNDSLTTLNKAIEGFGQTIGNTIIPALTDFVQGITPIVAQVTKWISAHTDLVTVVGEVAVALVGSGGLLLAIAGISAALPILSAALAGVGGELALVTGGLSILLPLAYNFRKEIAEAMLQAASLFTGALSGIVQSASSVAYALGMDGMSGKLQDASKYLQGTSNDLADMTNALMAEKDNAAKTTVAVKEHGEAHAIASKSVQEYTKSVQALIDQIQGEGKEQLVLIGAVQKAVDIHLSMQSIIDVLGPKIEKLVQQWQEEGKAIPAAVQAVYDAIKAHEEFSNLLSNASKWKFNLSGYESDIARINAHVDDTYSNVERLRGLLQQPLPPMVVDTGWGDFNDVVQKALTEVGNLNSGQLGLNDTQKAAIAVVAQMNDTNRAAADYHKQVTAAMADEAKQTADLNRAVNDVKQSAGKVFDDMFVKGENVFTSLQNALKGGALSLGRAIFEDVTGALLGPVKAAFDDFFKGLMESSGLKDLGKSLGDTLKGALKSGSDDFDPDFVGPIQKQAPGAGKLIGGLMAGGIVAAAVPIITGLVGWIKSMFDPNRDLKDWASAQADAMKLANDQFGYTGVVTTLAGQNGSAVVTPGGYQVRSYDVGTPYVPSDGLAYLHKGEAVVPAAQNMGGNSDVTARLDRLISIMEQGSQINLDGDRVADVVGRRLYDKSYYGFQTVGGR